MEIQFLLRNLRNEKTATKKPQPMSSQIYNPFLISGYESPSYFCDREQETISIIETLRNVRNITLTSPRRIGKTGLIKHTFYRLKQLD
ncbi:MAG: hypothetical protein IJU13_04065, partial [Bacteroidales bacterium]|nr:hypothetical protein [Bacteroidales bacterium]